MLKHVAPIDPAASIPDPDRRDFLPAQGRTVPWTPYWAGLRAREEITVGDPVVEPAAPAAEAEPAVEAVPGAEPEPGADEPHA